MYSDDDYYNICKEVIKRPRLFRYRDGRNDEGGHKLRSHWYCGRCGAHCLVCDAREEDGGKVLDLAIATSLLDRTKGIVKWKDLDTHQTDFDNDTQLGKWLGMDTWIRSIAYPAPKQEQGNILTTRRIHIQPGKEEEDILPASCQCKLIQFHITRPSLFTSISSPYPDLLYPYHSTPAEVLNNPKDEKWWIRPSPSHHNSIESHDHNKKEKEKTTSENTYLSGLCTCPTCLHISGSEFQAWTFVPLSNIFLRDGTPLQLSRICSNLHDLNIYTSSPNAHRAWCMGCGATVFWFSSAGRSRGEEGSGENQRGGNEGDRNIDNALIDISTGLFDLDAARGGKRGREWISWHRERISFSEMIGEGRGELVKEMERRLSLL